jgi:23S rRNA (adenine2503-C2)-methyltransferase
MTSPSMLGMLAPDLVQATGGALTEPEARRVLAHIISHGHDNLDGMARPVRKSARDAVRRATTWARPVVEERVVDPVDGSVRFLLALPDGALVEAVRIPLHIAGRFSVCLSSQVGCAMRCAFCATGRLGLRRDLSAAEMVACFVVVRDDAPGRTTGAVFMGQGEPLHNYDAVIQAARVLSHPCGGRISAKGISISTVGLVPRIHQFAAEGHSFRLVISLTSAIADKREALLPVAGRWSLQELADAIRAVHQAQGRRLTVAWVLMGGVNTQPEEVHALQALLPDVPLRINLIDVNDPRPGGFVRASDAERGAFVDALQVMKMPVVRRYSVGMSRNSACGMLAGQREVHA